MTRHWWQFVGRAWREAAFSAGDVVLFGAGAFGWTLCLGVWYGLALYALFVATAILIKAAFIARRTEAQDAAMIFRRLAADVIMSGPVDADEALAIVNAGGKPVGATVYWNAPPKRDTRPS